MSPCPSDESLKSLGTDALADAEYAAIEEHVENCARCKAALERLVRKDPGLPIPLPAPEQWPQIPGFEIRRELGRGAMSVVYQAWQPRLRRHVALKIVRSGPGFGSREQDRWLREAQAYTCVRHPNIVPLHEAGEAGPWLYLVLEYMPGGSLKHRLDIPYAARDAARLLEAIGRAIAAVHAEGMVHLDLKPSNIMLDLEPGQPREGAIPRLGDFGISLRWSDREASLEAESLSGPLGTPSYMAPEQVTGNRAAIGPAADIYGLGALLYHVLTGRAPFSAPSAAETLEQVRHQEPVPLRRLIPQIPRDLETIALKCLEKNPASRYVTAEAMADDLRLWLDGRPILARPVSPLENLWRKCCRRPMVAALTALLMLTLSFGFLAVVLLWRHAEWERRRAEDEFAFAGAMLGEICTAGKSGSAQFLVLPRDDAVAALRRTIDRILHRRTQRPEDPATCQQLARLHYTLAGHFEAQRKPDACRSSLVACLENLERVLRDRPRDWGALFCRFNAYRKLATVSEQEGKREEGLAHLEQAVAHGQECLRPEPNSALIHELARCRWSLAQSYRRCGNDESARSLVLANLHMLDELPKDDGTPVIAIWRTLARLDLHQFQAGLSSARAAPGTDHTDPLSRLSSAEADRLDAASWAELVVRCLSSGPGAIDLVGDDLDLFMQCLSERIAWRRCLGRIDEAQRFAERMHALARLLVARYPDRPDAHLALCASFTQMAKNAWKTDDRSAVEQNWKLAIDEARRALVLDPQDARAGNEVADLQKRLDMLMASNPASCDQNGTAPTAGESGR